MGWDEQNAWAAARGLRGIRTADWCPSTITGKKCQRYTLSKKRRVKGVTCTCEDPAIEQIMDHYRVWFSLRTWYVLTADPYGITTEQIEDIRWKLFSLGLTVRVGEESPWDPGATQLIITLKEVTEEKLAPRSGWPS